MINHLRTLLLNSKDKNSTGALYPLEEYSPTDFVPTPMSSECQRVWNILFGASSDRVYRNCILYQIVQAVEVSDLKKYWYKFDSRVTHFDRIAVDESRAFGRVSILEINNGNSADYINSYNGVVLDPSKPGVDPENVGVLLFGVLTSDEKTGRCFSSWKIDITAETELQITDLTTNLSYYHSLTYEGGLSQNIPMLGTGLSIRLRYCLEGNWQIDAIAKPDVNIGLILANIQSSASSDVDQILAGAYPEYKILYSYWHNNLNTAERLAAVVTGLAYKLQEKRSV